MKIRQVIHKDAEKLEKLIKQVESESDFMLMNPGERKTTVEQFKKQMDHFDKQENAVIFGAELDAQLIGYLMAIGGSVERTKHSAFIVVGILKEYRGKGIGTKLFERLDDWAREVGLVRLELTVVTKNEAGLSLYTKSGFEIEGLKRRSLSIDGLFYDEHYMSKLL
ncbi:GNAT family N-acetyltransferase [Bacillus sp. FJAT-45037]|uniref:GNAT family N-acetyltransferase n=1 Tax=Bacillus sp. FJAT-45037 TaxID=2011007 RepID=UPI000C23F784|nr:GNAT family N-acetyltransferase [Bacillus sp. FJAT-45037]